MAGADHALLSCVFSWAATTTRMIPTSSMAVAVLSTPSSDKLKQISTTAIIKQAATNRRATMSVRTARRRNSIDR